jgi:hypothetical protein
MSYFQLCKLNLSEVENHRVDVDRISATAVRKWCARK